MQITQRIAIALVFAAGVGSIMATTYINDTFLTKLEISPQYRCAGTDVRLKWATNKTAPLSVEINNIPYDLGEAAEYLIPAEIMDAVDYSTSLDFSLPDGPTGFWDVHWIRTFNTVALTKQTLRQAGSAGLEYRFRFEPGTWDQRLRVTRVSIADWQCFNRDGWEARWRVERRPRDKFVLNAENLFERKFESPVPAVGEWVFVADPVKRPSFKGKRYPPTCFEPKIEVSLVCTD